MYICKTGCPWIYFNTNLINKMSVVYWCYSTQSQHIHHRARKLLTGDSKIKKRQKKRNRNTLQFQKNKVTSLDIVILNKIWNWSFRVDTVRQRANKYIILIIFKKSSASFCLHNSSSKLHRFSYQLNTAHSWFCLVLDASSFLAKKKLSVWEKYVFPQLPGKRWHSATTKNRREDCFLTFKSFRNISVRGG